MSRPILPMPRKPPMQPALAEAHASPAVDPFVSIHQATQISGRSRSALLTLVAAREIASQRIAGRIVLRRADVEALPRPQA